MGIEWDRLKRELAKEMATSLAASLPEIGGENWWTLYVLNELTPAQRYQVELLSNPDIFQLDLAAILRLFKRNWSELSLKKGFAREGGNLVAELISARNRWAHEPASGHDLEDLYRDLDTTKRFLELISQNQSLISKVDKYRGDLLKMLADRRNGEHSAPNGVPLKTPGIKNESLGAPLTVIGAGSIADMNTGEYADLLGKKTFIGIDFGTSTTVASYIRLSDDNTSITVEPIKIAQNLPDGRTSRNHLVPSCIAINPADGSILFGLGAKELQYQLREGIDVWSSFKMELGLDQGPTYRNTKLRHGDRDVVIENAQDATREFFKFLRRGIEDFLQSNGLPNNISLAVSVPASFEANQRRDIIEALDAANFEIDEACLIDEPNAAFLSVLHESWVQKSNFADFLEEESRNILVFDFGAGTCDISILRISVTDRTVMSKNLSISRFLALGGNNIDRQIADKILLPQMMSQSKPESVVTSENIDSIVLPRLMPIAERLKIQCSKWLSQKGIQDLDDCRSLSETITDHDIADLILGRNRLSLRAPTIKLTEFAEIMSDFVEPVTEHADFDELLSQEKSIFTPIYSALNKANLDKTALNSILFIGGSSENPIIQCSIKEHFGRFVDTLIPRDLRTHVSQGAAFHSFAHHAFGTDVIQPITSEPIFLVTNGGGLDELLSAGSEVPTSEARRSTFEVPSDNQSKLELPICVTSENKILTVLRIDPPLGQSFRKGQNVVLHVTVTPDKLLKVDVQIDGKSVTSELLNPLANTPLTLEEATFLKARQEFSGTILANRGGRPPVKAVIEFARACSEAKRYLQAAEIYEQAEQLDSSQNMAVSICFNYDRAGRNEKAEEWSEKAYTRNLTAVSAFNAAIFKHRSGDNQSTKRLLEESLRISPNYTSSLTFLADVLDELGTPDPTLYQKAIVFLKRELKDGSIDEGDCSRLIRVAGYVGDKTTQDEAKLFMEKLNRQYGLYNPENLIGRTGFESKTSWR
jgi:molecular chaperone DnaK